jgi:DNA invertase Pin-like site-specific DNA recombinase
MICDTLAIVSCQRRFFMTLAFSYIRFSSKAQELGDSLRRQTELSVKYCQDHELQLSTQNFEDLGVSAFKGMNADVAKGGGLGLFLRAVDEGMIPEGSTLLVESLDRLSRNTVDYSLELLLSIIRRGITVVSMIDNQVFSQESIKSDRGIGLIISITSFMRAHEESSIKSSRVASAWTTKRKNQKIITRVCPAWLTVNKDMTAYELIPEKVEVVQLVFKLSLANNGLQLIARRLNELNLPLMSGKLAPWKPENVNHLIKNPAVFGRYVASKAKGVPDVEDQYPAIVSREEFDKVQEMTSFRTAGRKGSRNNIANLFAGKMKCSACGSRLRSTSTASDRTTYYMHCQNAYGHQGCEATRVYYGVLESRLLETIFSRTEVAPKHSPIQLDYKKLIDDKQAQLDRLVNFLMAGNTSDAVQRKIPEIEAELETFRRLSTKARAFSPDEMVFSRAKSLHQKLKTATEEDEVYELRLKLQGELARIVDEVKIAPKDHEQDEKFYRKLELFGLVSADIDCELLKYGQRTKQLRHN